MVSTMDIALRLLLATVLGGLVGLERSFMVVQQAFALILWYVWDQP